MRWIYISPHLDDAVFSAGGLIHDQARAGAAVEVWTLFCGVPQGGETSAFAQTLHAQWGFRSAEETVGARRAEDRRALKIVGAGAAHFDFLDCVYRRGADGKWLYAESAFAPPHADDASLPGKIALALAGRLAPDDEIACPLAIGGHVDHVLARRAVEALGRPLWYFADFPYLAANPSALEMTGRAMPAERRAVSWRGLDAWARAAASYESQVSMEFESPGKLKWSIFAHGFWGVRLWRRVPA